MNERERLVELILECDKSNEVLSCFNERPRKRQAAEILADHLLANGVLCPPCKVGDMVYSLAKDINSQIFEGVVHEITQRREESYFRFTRVGYYGGACSFEDFGKTVFRSPDLAEAALRERKRK